MNNFLKLNKDIKIYCTHGGEISENLKKIIHLKILFLLVI